MGREGKNQFYSSTPGTIHQESIRDCRNASFQESISEGPKLRH